ncbi:uncharacterized protein F4812DRAFT_417894 [Daldinia caldariorum]|uniref:uncharacterized protein n=1 Tax=Daldinia caldariorum TaxID=326644 RepID=UPI002008A237|nr:uncharacterized protein F4812DRAFT_417894 [Daldinia caldariorum]KAI1470511.1 hypothetical protein F4812DRAFT_417894 [Daldinia caldariorum]
MAEFYRVAQVAARSTPLLRSSASIISNIRLISTSPILRSVDSSDTPPKDPVLSPRSPLSRARFQNYTSPKWSDPFREQEEDDGIKKPDISVYNDVLAPEIDFEIGELHRNKIVEPRPAPTRPPVRLVPRTGRTVHVTKNSDVARTFQILNIQVSGNRVRYDAQKQRFHERPGLKRKRLKSERWQKRFQRGFKACVKRVSELVKQGW